MQEEVFTGSICSSEVRHFYEFRILNVPWKVLNAPMNVEWQCSYSIHVSFTQVEYSRAFTHLNACRISPSPLTFSRQTTTPRKSLFSFPSSTSAWFVKKCSTITANSFHSLSSAASAIKIIYGFRILLFSSTIRRCCAVCVSCCPPLLTRLAIMCCCLTNHHCLSGKGMASGEDKAAAANSVVKKVENGGLRRAPNT